MIHTRTWTVDIDITEDESERFTHAAAALRSGVRHPLRGEGEARRRPADTEVPEIGDELATARALADLAYKLLAMTAGDIEQFTHDSVHLPADVLTGAVERGRRRRHPLWAADGLNPVSVDGNVGPFDWRTLVTGTASA
jgi:hypothetical protein